LRETKKFYYKFNRGDSIGKARKITAIFDIQVQFQSFEEEEIQDRDRVRGSDSGG
jgi:hypothetical protein